MLSTDTTKGGSGEPLLFVEEAAAFVGLSPLTLNTYRGNGKGPPYRYVPGGRVAYSRTDLEAWTAETDDLLTSAEAAVLARCTQKNLENMRSYGKGPAFLKLRGHRGPHRVFYRPADVIAWRDAR
jgi:Helix-turn-helix domain